MKPFLSTTPNYTQRIETKITVSKLYRSGPRVKNVKIIHYWLRGYKCQHYTQFAKREKF